MKKIVFAVLMSVIGLSAFAHEEGEAKDDSIKGEVMDLACYASHPDTGKGESHAKCAMQCMEKGLPVGVLTSDGVLYIALGSEHVSANKKLVPYAGKIVTVEGHVYEMNNVKFIEVEEVEAGA
ncbi:MAG: hypothetical protein HYS08_09155 [Chlamydiae bacterium]|nr:hypothetical protein [Chlamydiota bacterium]MBI3265530.1 hypothetical protein [Chlamydiota bacterium]